jgi:hypothetical protein
MRAPGEQEHSGQDFSCSHRDDQGQQPDEAIA